LSSDRAIACAFISQRRLGELNNRKPNPSCAYNPIMLRFNIFPSPTSAVVQMIDASGQSRSSTSSSDSYAVDIFRPVALPGSRHLITPSGSVSQASLNLILAGSGFVTCPAPQTALSLTSSNSRLKFSCDFLRHMHHKIGNLDMAEAKLRHLESRPTLPDFYRRSTPAE
jgi:hypothetical protein